jgi:hypothetical protein
MVPARIPQPLGAVIGVVKFAAKHGLMPGPEKTLGKPHDERLKRVPPAPEPSRHRGPKNREAREAREYGEDPGRQHARPVLVPEGGA